MRDEGSMNRSSTMAWPVCADRGRASKQAAAAARLPQPAGVSVPELDQIQRLIGDIYDAAVEPSRWNAVLARAQTFVGGPAAAVLGVFRGEQHDVLDGMSAGMFFVDATGRIAHANASGRALLAQGSPLRAVGGKLVATGAEAARALADVVAAAGQGDATAAGIRGIAVALTAANGDHYMAHVLPLSLGTSRRTDAGAIAVATVFVRKATVEAPSLPETIARHFKLTAAELRVLLAVAEIGGVAETAAALGIGEATVKTHLHRVFGKTGASRQADLVKLVAGFANPLVS
jgi:DNA-binding CsgD family transcriptional regulator